MLGGVGMGSVSEVVGAVQRKSELEREVERLQGVQQEVVAMSNKVGGRNGVWREGRVDMGCAVQGATVM